MTFAAENELGTHLTNIGEPQISLPSGLSSKSASYTVAARRLG